LRRLQNAANSYSKTGKAPYLDTNHGPLEIRQVNQAFNHMVYTLEQTERDRQIMLAGISRFAYTIDAYSSHCRNATR
jgi:two-component system osmolarity sensor histidine kinase EnvZ